MVEPYCQLYQHTQLSDGSPSKSAKVWKDVKDLNGKRFKKHKFIGYNYVTREVTYQSSRFESVNEKKLQAEKKISNNEKEKATKKTTKETSKQSSSKNLKRKVNKDTEATEEKKQKTKPTPKGKARGKQAANKKKQQQQKEVN